MGLVIGLFEVVMDGIGRSSDRVWKIQLQHTPAGEDEQHVGQTYLVRSKNDVCKLDGGK